MQDAEFVFHMAANADVRFGTQHPRRDLEQNTIGTANVLEAMRPRGVRRIALPFHRLGLWRARHLPHARGRAFPVQTSLYAASKLAGEALIEAYCEGFGMQGYIFRFVSILGSAIPMATSLISTRPCRPNPASCRFWETAATQVVPLRAGLHGRHPDGHRKSPG